MDRLIRMILNRLMGQLVNKGITHLANRGKTQAEMTPDERAQAQLARQAGRRAAEAARIARRLMR